MPRREVQKRAHRKTAIGDMRHQIGIYSAVTVGRSDGGADQVLQLVSTFWGSVETVDLISERSLEIEKVNIEKVPTHRITCRQTARVTADRLLGLHNGTRLFKIISITPVNEAGEYWKIMVRSLGDATQEAAQA